MGIAMIKNVGGERTGDIKSNIELQKLGPPENQESSFDSNSSLFSLDEKQEFLSDLERDVFKTADEIDQNWIIEHASKRQEFICQAQSVNLFFVAPRIQEKQEEHDNFLRYTNKVHFQAWKKGLKSLYYLRSREGKSAENINMKVNARC